MKNTGSPRSLVRRAARPLLLSVACAGALVVAAHALPNVLPRIAALGAATAPAGIAPAAASTTALAATVQLSAVPPNQTQSVPPNIVMTFDDSGSMNWTRLGDVPPYTTNPDGSGNGLPDWNGGPWRCANVVDPDHTTATDAAFRASAMNGVYYNPAITYTPPYYANGTQFPNADATLAAVWVDGMAVKRPLNPIASDSSAAYNDNPDLDYPSAGSLTNLVGTLNPPIVTNYYVTFGTTCPSSAEAASCQTNKSGWSNGDGAYVYYIINSNGSTGTGINTTYFGAALQTRTSSRNGYTKVVGDSSDATKYYTTWTVTNDSRWRCGQGGSNQGSQDGWNAASPMDGKSHTLSDGTTVTYPNGGPYYYRLKTGVTIAVDQYGNPTSSGATALYTASNWEAVPVPVAQYQNFANWYAYYRTRNQMARSSIARVFGSGGLAHSIVDPNMWDDGGFGSTIRMAWQNLNTSAFKLPSSAIISSLIDTSACNSNASAAADPQNTQRSGSTKTPPSCYRSAFFNWIFQVPASGGTPTRSAVARAGGFYQRGTGNTGASGTLTDPYWQPPASGTGNGNELACRQNYHMLVTDGLFNGNGDGPQYSSLTLPPTTLPDGVVMPSPSNGGVTSIYAPVHDGGDSGYASLSDVAFHYWATNLRNDLYNPASGDIVSPYLPDSRTSVFNLATLSGSSIPLTNVNQEIYFNPVNDPATWPHMSQYLVGLGVNGVLNFSQDTDCTAGSTDTSDACLLRTGAVNSSGFVGWPTPDGSGSGIPANIDDTWHAALAGRGQFFSAGNPQQLVDQLSKILSNISARNVPPATTALNTSVLVPGALAFTTGYNAADWSGTLQAVQANADGSVGNSPLWDSASKLTNPAITDPTARAILTAKENADGSFGGGIAFEAGSAYDTAAKTVLMVPSTGNAADTLANRVNYLRGVRTQEATGLYRKRNSLMGAIIDSHAVYVAYPASGYTDNWPASSPEATAATSGNTNDDGSYEQFVQNHISRTPVVYVGANDGMLHAFDASEQQSGTPPQIGPTATAGREVFAYVPRSVYANLGNLTSNNFSFLPTVDGTPVTRDVFFDSATSSPASTTAGWHTLLVGNLRNGGRGIYALDVTDPTTVTEANAGSKVLWEFNSDSPASASPGCYASYGTCNPQDLGFTYGEPNIGRLANGKWVVLVPGGYFPDCTRPPYNTNCPTPNGAPTAGSPLKAFSSLFVLDAQTGAMIAELKTPTNINGVSSYGLSSPVLGDYNNDQVDDVAFAGDLAGNLWRYDLTSTSPSGWTVSLLFQPATQGTQPITSMPRLFPDPATNRFMVVFGTGKYLGANDNTSTGVPTQAIYGIRDLTNASGGPVLVNGTGNLVQQKLAEQAVTNAAGVTNTLRGLTDNPISATQSGWYILLNLPTSPGERMVVTPGALFDSNRVVVTTLIPATNDPCTATITGATMVLSAANGGSAGGLSNPVNSAWTGASTFRVVGAQVNNPPTSGTVPVATVVGGGSLLTPGLSLTGGGALRIDDAVWRRRSWGELDNDN